MSNITKDAAKRILQSRKLITAPGKYTLKVTSVTPYSREINEEAQMVNIVNFNAMTNAHLNGYTNNDGERIPGALELFQNEEYQDAVNKSCSTNVLEGQYTPSKGEIVDVEFDFIKTANVDKALLPVAVIQRQAVTAGSVNLSSLLGEDDEETVETAVEEKEMADAE